MNGVLPQSVGDVRGQRVEAGKFRIGLIVAGKKGDLDAVFAGHPGDLFDPIRPVAAPAKQPHDNQFGAADDLFGIHIDRHVVTQVKQVGEAQGREIGRIQLPAGDAKGREFRIGGAQENDVAGGLAQIDGFRTVRYSSRRGGKQMHGLPSQ